MGSTTGSPASRATQSAPATQLTERDIALLCDLWGFGLLLRDNIHALHFKKCELRRVNRRLKALGEAGCILGHLLPLGPLTNPTSAAVPGSRSQRVYRLGMAGAEIVARRMGVDIAAVRRRVQEGSRTHAAHALEVANARVTLERAACCAGVEVVSFSGEAPLLHAFEVRESDRPGASWRAQVFKPDGLALCRHGGEDHYLFFEIDLSAVATAEFARKLRVHGTYLREGLFSRRYGAEAARARTLVLTTGARRAERLRRLAEDEGAGFAWFTTLDAYAAQGEPGDGPFSPIWDVPFAGEPQSLFPIE